MVATAAGRTPGAARGAGYGLEKDSGMQPAKLFIGGITRHTTTKHLRDHFSRYGRVLDCVAMRQPDGRPRGFGYVTLDSHAAADRCLAEPQVVDGRHVDMKRAVPEGSGGTPPGAAMGPVHGYSHAHDSMMGMPLRTQPPPLFEWDSSMATMAQGPYHAGSPHMGSVHLGTPHMGSVLLPDVGATSPLAGGDRLLPPWSWTAPQTPEAAGDTLDCVELLSRRVPVPASLTATQPLPALTATTPLHGDATRLDSVDLLVGKQGPGSPSALVATPSTTASAGALSPSAPEFVPMSASKETPESEEADDQLEENEESRPEARPALGEITNIVAGSPKDSEKKLSHKGGLLEKGAGSPASGLGGSGGLENMRTPAKHNASMLEVMEEPAELIASDLSKETVATAEADEATPDAEKKGEDDLMEEPEDESPSEEAIVKEPVELPSMGSADHALGTCKRCNFFPKGRCQNGKDCTFCHFPHDKRKPSRQEKRERKAAWLAQHQGQPGALMLEEDFDEDEDEDSEDASQQVVAYPVLPGMPASRSIKLPSPLALPGCIFEPVSANYPRPPPGLLPPAPARSGLEIWQPEEEISPLQYDVALSPYGTPMSMGSPFGAPAMPPSASLILATVPRSASASVAPSVAPSAPPSGAPSLAPSPVNASAVDLKAAFPADLAKAPEAAKPRPAKVTCTISTQTEEDSEEAADDSAEVERKNSTPGRSRRIFLRDDLLRHRCMGSEPLQVAGASVLFRAVARGECEDASC